MIELVYQYRDIEQVMAVVRELFGWSVCAPHDLMNLLEQRQGTRWSHINEWEGMSDCEIFERIDHVKCQTGHVLVISDASYVKRRGAFSVNPGKLCEFVDAHLNLFGECLFNGDVLFICADQGVIFAFHHEGVWARFDVPELGLWGTTVRGQA